MYCPIKVWMGPNYRIAPPVEKNDERIEAKPCTETRGTVAKDVDNFYNTVYFMLSVRSWKEVI